MIEEFLSITAASIPISLVAWFVAAIATRIFTRWQPIRPKLSQASRAIATVETKPVKALPIQPSVTSQPKPLVPAQIVPTVTLAYESMSLAQLRKVARKRGITPAGDARKREAWIDALLAKQE